MQSAEYQDRQFGLGGPDLVQQFHVVGTGQDGAQQYYVVRVCLDQLDGSLTGAGLSGHVSGWGAFYKLLEPLSENEVIVHNQCSQHVYYSPHGTCPQVYLSLGQVSNRYAIIRSASM
jgi:hypothetical protein